MILCVAGNPSIDKLFVVDHLRPGEIHRPVDFVQVAGGKGLNVSRAVGTLGTDVRVAMQRMATRWEGITDRYGRNAQRAAYAEYLRRPGTRFHLHRGV